MGTPHLIDDLREAVILWVKRSLPLLRWFERLTSTLHYVMILAFDLCPILPKLVQLAHPHLNIKHLRTFRLHHFSHTRLITQLRLLRHHKLMPLATLDFVVF